MFALDILQAALFAAALILLTPPLGLYMARVLEGRWRFLAPVETAIYRLCGIRELREMSWRQYAGALIAFNIIGLAVLLAILMGQGFLPLNPQSLPGMKFLLALNTAISFVTNTNWQAYSGESALSYFSQMAGLTVQNFVSPAVGVAVMLGLIRGFVRRTGTTVGNFWADLVRTVLYILLPLSILFTIVLAGQGVVQNLSGYVTATTVEGAQQSIPMGPAASQVAIKQLGTNGGGFFGVNSAHPFENPTPLTNFLELLAIFLIPAALTYTFGVLTGDRRQGWALFGAMFILFLAGFAASWWAESRPNPITHVPINMEGKEQRFGVMNSVLWSTATTDASNGSVNSMHDSLSPIAGMVAMLNMKLGEVIYGGVGAGMYGMLMYVLLTVFIAGLMVGRTPEYLGKKIEAREVRLAVIALFVPSGLILVGAAIAASVPAGLSSLANAGPHGLSEILYAFASALGNNGSAFAGLTVDTPFYNLMLGAGMLIGRFIVIIPALMIAGSMVRKTAAPPSPGTFPTNTPLFAALLVSVILIVSALFFLPALTLGPISEHMVMLQGRTF
ncbi:K+-transporting ATPase ATPase A chain [Terrimicrobium sacchariphilum]|uniref:Potassium-transporting ATPase potassium-binding subunit n=1 Tax=Terrimicrobium sacchariphilum TaxID=690879 RepID=A0A146GF74_TERSA|nr:potassium-transporting ATPase subunit KdpA [Terrimicrobium sacchariphilum]GAT35118.1 K+-transporting ATPase ATPase A chain [Terrimicrobium sacchariphilum]